MKELIFRFVFRKLFLFFSKSILFFNFQIPFSALLSSDKNAEITYSHQEQEKIKCMKNTEKKKIYLRSYKKDQKQENEVTKEKKEEVN